MKKPNFRLIACTLFLLVSLCACAGDKFPTGKFTHLSSGVYSNDYDWEERDDGSFVLYANGEEASRGTYTIDVDQFKFETDTFYDSLNAGKAAYTWSYEDEIIYFEAKGHGPCEYRRMAVDYVHYKKGP